MSKIEIPKSTKSTEELLKKAKLQKTEEPSKKRGRGRPPKKRKPIWDDGKRYEGHIVAKVVNKFLLGFANKFLKENPMNPEDCQIGEAILYTIDYYGITPDHPIIVLGCASGFFVMEFIDHASEITAKKKKEAKVPPKAKGKEGLVQHGEKLQ